MKEETLSVLYEQHINCQFYIIQKKTQLLRKKQCDNMLARQNYKPF